MKTYAKPMILTNDELAEGIYAASGDDCYTVTANIHQRPQQGRGDYRIQVGATHAAGDGHHSTEQTLILDFNQPVEYKSSNGSLVSGDGTSTIAIRFAYHNNAHDGCGMGDVIVTANQGLAVTDVAVKCNMKCSQH